MTDAEPTSPRPACSTCSDRGLVGVRRGDDDWEMVECSDCPSPVSVEELEQIRARAEYRIESIALIERKQWGEIWYAEDVPRLLSALAAVQAENERLRAAIYRYSHPTAGVPYCGADARREMKELLG